MKRETSAKGREEGRNEGGRHPPLSLFRTVEERGKKERERD